MTQTKKVTATNTIQEVANSNTDTLVTIQSHSSHTVGIIVDDRTQVNRIADDDDISYHIGFGEERTFNGFVGTISVATTANNAEAVLMVMKS